MNILLSEFLKKPLATGAVCPSSSPLAEQLLLNFDWEKAKTVIELGAGTGAITRHILPKLNPDTKFIAVEMNELLAENLQNKFPMIQICNDNASNLNRIMISGQIQRADIIVSSLPWASMGKIAQDEIIEEVFKSLNVGGVFSTFCYAHGCFLPAACRFRKKIKEKFSYIIKKNIVWRNFPPAYCYFCVKH